MHLWLSSESGGIWDQLEDNDDALPSLMEAVRRGGDLGNVGGSGKY